MKRFCAEIFGTFGLVFAGTGAIIVNEASHGAITHIGIAMTFGLIVLAMIYTFGDISGAHLNPAVTLGFWAARRFPGADVIPYVTSQLMGAILASALLRFLFPQSALLGATMPAGTEMQSFIFEVVLTFFLMLTILNVSTGAKEKGITAGIAVGSVIALEAMFAGPICGASMNPARSFAPALLSGHFEHLWIYLAAPPLGACAAMFACRCVREGLLLRGHQNRSSCMKKKKVLFVCIHNSARSQMAEAFLNQACGDEFEAHSAGIEPGKLNPIVVEAMREIGVDISGNATKAVFDMIKSGKHFAYVITVCDETSAERCPIFPGVTTRLQWGFPDPSSFQGTHDEKLARTREVRDTIKARVDDWCAEVCGVAAS